MLRENLLAGLAVVVLAAIPACQNEMRQPPPPVAPVQTTLPKLAPTPTPAPLLSDAPSSSAPMPPSQREVGTPAVKDIPYAKPVAGKPGFVTLPGTSGQIDVRGMSPGEQVKDPATGQVFLVP